jgi:hypothetical protein
MDKGIRHEGINYMSKYLTNNIQSVLLYSRLAKEHKHVSITSVCVFRNVGIMLTLSTHV